MRSHQLTIFLIFFILLIIGASAYFILKQPIFSGAVSTTPEGDVIGFEVTIVDDQGNQYTYTSARPGIPTILKLPDNTRVSTIIVKLYINPNFVGTASYLKVAGGILRFHVMWGTVDNDAQVIDFSVNPVQINNPQAGVNNYIAEWSFTEADLENAAGAISDGTSLTFSKLVVSSANVHQILSDD